MAYTQTQIDNLRNAIIQGVLVVRQGDETVTYRSLSEMKQILADAEAEVNGRTRTTYAQFHDGLD